MYAQKEDSECNLFHVHNWIQFFISMYNDTTSTNDNYFVNQLQEEVINLT
jgi:putative transposase